MQFYMNDEISANPSKTNVYTNFTVLTKAPIIVPGAGLDLLHLITFWQSPLSTLLSPLAFQRLHFGKCI